MQFCTKGPNSTDGIPSFAPTRQQFIANHHHINSRCTHHIQSSFRHVFNRYTTLWACNMITRKRRLLSGHRLLVAQSSLCPRNRCRLGSPPKHCPYRFTTPALAGESHLHFVCIRGQNAGSIRPGRPYDDIANGTPNGLPASPMRRASCLESAMQLRNWRSPHLPSQGATPARTGNRYRPDPP